MTTAGAHFQWTDASTGERAFSMRRVMVASGIVGAVIYPLADIFAATRYPGFSYRDQAVSELFAIGAPTSDLVVSLFTASSTLLFLFAIGIWMSANGRGLVKAVAILMALNTINALVLWNFFPMHMRGQEQTFTDTMHGLLAIDPFLLAATVLAAIAFRGRFRVYTIATITFTTLLIVFSISSIRAFMAHEPTPWMGLAERAGQYATNVWYAVFAAMLLGQGPSRPQDSSPGR